MFYEIKQPSLYDDPKQHLRNLIQNNSQHDFETIIISLTATNDNKQLTAYAAKLDSNDLCNNQTDNHLISIFQLLHKPLVKYDEGDCELDALMDPSIPLDMKAKDCSLLHRCIHALATQELIYEEPNGSTAFRTLRASTFAATDIIRFTKSRAAGKFQKYITRHLVAYGADQSLWKVLN